MGFTLSFCPYQSCTANSLTFNLLFMERYTANLKLPAILSLHTVPGCSKRDEDRMVTREIFLHTGTGGVVEIFRSSKYIIGEEYTQMPFCEKSPGSELYHYTAVLLNTPQSISAENGLKAMEEVAKWYNNLNYELTGITSLEWCDCPKWIQEQ